MDRRRCSSEDGQVLIQVALMLVVLLTFVGLAIDGGLVYAERRQMQNAADAAALAAHGNYAWAIVRPKRRQRRESI